MCKVEKCRKKLHTEFPKKKKSEKNEIISRNSLHGQNVWDKKNVPLSDDNVKGKEAVLRL